MANNQLMDIYVHTMLYVEWSTNVNKLQLKTDSCVVNTNYK
jgi:hypothetical protein